MFKLKIRYVRLYDVYGTLLSERQREILELYYNEDQSLSEISENVGITRQGVRDCILKAETQMEGYEEALGLLGKLEALDGKIEALISSGDIPAEYAGKLRELRSVFF